MYVLIVLKVWPNPGNVFSLQETNYPAKSDCCYWMGFTWTGEIVEEIAHLQNKTYQSQDFVPICPFVSKVKAISPKADKILSAPLVTFFSEQSLHPEINYLVSLFLLRLYYFFLYYYITVSCLDLLGFFHALLCGNGQNNQFPHQSLD